MVQPHMSYTDRKVLHDIFSPNVIARKQEVLPNTSICLLLPNENYMIHQMLYLSSFS